MNRWMSTVAAAAFAVVTGPALAQGAPVTVQLGEQNKSGESGTATITQQGDKTQVVLEMKGAPSDAQPAHIHDGSCASLDPKPRIPLQNVTNGKSTTTLSMPMSQVTKGAINVHKSTTDLKTYVACGDLK